MDIAILVASFNRVDTTVTNLARLEACLDQQVDVDASFFVLDDASPDGTADRVAALGLRFHVIGGTGKLFWNRGMCWAYRRALQHGQHDAYLLFNDDVEIDCHGIRTLLLAYRLQNEKSPCILVGSTVDACGKLSYSGMRVQGRVRSMAFAMVEPEDVPVVCDTFNGNFVLIPGVLFRSLGGLDPVYTHAYGDLDLGLRAARRGVRILLSTLPVGVCNRGGSQAEQFGTPSAFKSFVRLAREPNGMWSYMHFVGRHRPALLFPVYAVQRLVRLAVDSKRRANAYGRAP